MHFEHQGDWLASFARNTRTYTDKHNRNKSSSKWQKKKKKKSGISEIEALHTVSAVNNHASQKLHEMCAFLISAHLFAGLSLWIRPLWYSTSNRISAIRLSTWRLLLSNCYLAVAAICRQHLQKELFGCHRWLFAAFHHSAEKDRGANWVKTLPLHRYYIKSCFLRFSRSW